MDKSIFCEKIGENYNRIFFRFAGKNELSNKTKKLLTISYLDMTVIFYMQLKISPDESIIMYITEDNIEKWKIGSQELLRLAEENSASNKKAVVRKMKDMIKDMGVDDISDDEGIFVLTNTDVKYGAAAVMYPNLKEMIYEMMGGDYCILPSSIHECILLRCNENTNIEDLKTLVYNVNRTEVKAEEVLSDSVYLCRKTGSGCKIDIF